MKKFTAPLLSVFCLIFLVNLTKEETSTISGETLHKRNFYAVVVYRDGRKSPDFIDNLSISNMLNKINLLNRPSPENLDEVKHTFKIDPRIQSRNTEDTPPLDNIEIIEIPHPQTIWRYVRNEEDEKRGINSTTEFIEIKVYCGNTSDSYFVDLKRPIMGNKLAKLTSRQAAPFLAPQEYNATTIEHLKQTMETVREDVLTQQSCKGIAKTFAYPQLKRVFIGGWKYREEPSTTYKECPTCKPCNPCICPRADAQLEMPEMLSEHMLYQNDQPELAIE